ncbi:hypothetical protein ANN_23137 [Periplaneta americana]|uniref:Uncharacterized protein n=1 Tax=Periplaneta americana TaxID=6978 RepID=A0ABQ8SK95_PERAM|nr:hypothetical protein ANN_23137 [Periplaneta americana]
MSPGSSTESHPAFARIGLRKNPGKNLNQVTCPDRDSNPGHLVSRPGALTVIPQLKCLFVRKLSPEDDLKYDSNSVNVYDTTFIITGENINEMQLKVYETIQASENWFDNNGLYVNKDKTQNVLFKMCNIEVNYAKLLGLTFDIDYGNRSFFDSHRDGKMSYHRTPVVEGGSKCRVRFSIFNPKQFLAYLKSSRVIGIERLDHFLHRLERLKSWPDIYVYLISYRNKLDFIKHDCESALRLDATRRSDFPTLPIRQKQLGFGGLFHEQMVNADLEGLSAFGFKISDIVIRKLLPNFVRSGLGETVERPWICCEIRNLHLLLLKMTSFQTEKKNYKYHCTMYIKLQNIFGNKLRITIFINGIVKYAIVML